MDELDRQIGGCCAPAAAARPLTVRPRVLFLCCHLPWPPISGGRRRELELIRRVADRFDVHLVVERDPVILARSFFTEVAERACWARASRLAAVTPEDAEIIEMSSHRGDVRVVPDGADHIRSVRPVDSSSAPKRPAGPLVVMV